jgi:hypothetical protein
MISLPLPFAAQRQDSFAARHPSAVNNAAQPPPNSQRGSLSHPAALRRFCLWRMIYYFNVYQKKRSLCPAFFIAKLSAICFSFGFFGNYGNYCNYFFYVYVILWKLPSEPFFYLHGIKKSSYRSYFSYALRYIASRRCDIFASQMRYTLLSVRARYDMHSLSRAAGTYRTFRYIASRRDISRIPAGMHIAAAHGAATGDIQRSHPSSAAP